MSCTSRPRLMGGALVVALLAGRHAWAAPEAEPAAGGHAALVRTARALILD
jgi:hypothetical protein